MVSRQRVKITEFWFPLVVSIILYSIGDVLLKQGNVELASTFQSLLQGDFWLNFAFNLPIICAFSCSFASKLIVGYVLAKNPFSLSEGLFIAFSVIFTFNLGVILFKEQIDISDLVGIFIIAIGIIFLYSGYKEKKEIRNNEM